MGADGAVEHSPQEDLREQDDAAEHHSGQHDVEDVAVQDMAHLVGDHALELIAVESAQQAGGDRERGGLGAPARGEGVGSRIVDDVDLGHGRQTRRDLHLFHDVEQLGVHLVGDRPGSAGRQQDLVSRGETDERQYEPDHRRDAQARHAAFRANDRQSR